MKRLKALFSALVAMFMVFSMSATAIAQTIDSNKGGDGEITIENASRGIKYTVTKIFDATYNETTNAVAYTYSGTMSENRYFEKDSTTGAITVKADGKDEDDNLTQEAAKWLKDNITGTVVVSEQEATDGDSLIITGLQYGYYLITSDLGTGTALSVDTTKPTATMYDKNYNNPHFDEEEEQGKKADKTNVKIGETVTYTIDFTATNYTGSGADAKKVTAYKIEDDLPDFLGEVNVTSITVKEDESTNPTIVTKQFKEANDNDGDKVITISWVDDEGNSRYKNNSVITITYTAKVTAAAEIAGNGNTNTVKITPMSGDEPAGDYITENETIKTYALAIKKVNEEGTALPGAKFQFPFAVVADPNNDGQYFVNASASEQTAELATDENGLIIIKGVAAGSYNVEETEAPQGYNKLASMNPVEATVATTTTTSVTKYIDSDGQVVDTVTDKPITYENDDLSADVVFVVNRTGSVLPSTGGIGTTIFYIVGGVMVAGAAIFLLTKRRMSGSAQ